jgi:hypothetical protein
VTTLADRRFEEKLAEELGKRPCDWCRRPLGNGPRKIVRHRHFHPACYEVASAAFKIS